jgi:hypothetical protein
LLLGCGPAVWWGFGCAVAVGDDAALVLVAVAAADTDDAGAAGPDDPLLGWPAALEPESAAEVDTDDPPHAASSRTSDPIPVAAAHPLLRITSLQFTVMLVPEGSLQGEPDTKQLPAVVATDQGTPTVRRHSYRRKMISRRRRR